jgi:hypothetical protein
LTLEERCEVFVSTASGSALSGVVVDLPSLSANFPSAPHPELLLDNVISTLKSRLHDDVYAVAVEGPEGIGKTTILSQFVRKNPHFTISLFVSAANRLSYDPDLIRRDIAVQVFWIITNEILERAKYDPTLLKSYYADLQRLAKQRKEAVYFAVDGIEELEVSDRHILLQQMPDILPIGIPQFRFVFSGDETLYEPLVGPRLLLKPFLLTEFGVEETRELFSAHDLSTETAREINSICRGIPGRLAGVLRAMDKGMRPVDFLRDPPSGFFEVDWNQVDSNNAGVLRLRALLAHDLKPHTVDDLASILGMSDAEVQTALATVSFLVVEPNTQNVRFMNDGLRRFVATRLKDKKANIQKLLIKRLMAVPTSEESVLDLPEYLEDASEFQDLLDLLTPDHILQILERSQTLSRVSDTVQRGFRSAKRIGRDGDLLRFGIQKSVIAELAAASVWESEVAALAALKRDNEALALANNAVLREDRLQMLTALAYGVWLRGDAVQPELLEQIGLLIGNLDLLALGKRARKIAAKLICVSPDLATILLKKAQVNEDGNDLDLSFAHLTLHALTDQKDELRRTQAIESASRTRQDPEMKALLDGVSVLFGGMDPAEVCKRADEIKEPEAKVNTLRSWCVLKGSTPDADLIAGHALRFALGTTSVQIDASLLADLSMSLAGAPTASRKKDLIAALDGVRGTAERLGPSVDYVRLQLSVALAEADIDASAAESRLLQTLDAVSRIGDLPARGESYARFLSTLKMLPSGIALASQSRPRNAMR